MFEKQVKSDHYIKKRYNHKVRWMNFWHQIDLLWKSVSPPANILEIGKGSGIVTSSLEKMRYKVTTLDIDENLNPGIVASVEKIPLEDNSFDVVLCAEVLEHIPYENVLGALKEMRRVSKKFVIISLPFSGSRVNLSIKFPKISEINLFIPIPYFWKTHKVTREHYWEVGKSGYSTKKIKKLIEKSNLKILKTKIFSNDFDHIFFVCQK